MSNGRLALVMFSPSPTFSINKSDIMRMFDYQKGDELETPNGDVGKFYSYRVVEDKIVLEHDYQCLVEYDADEIIDINGGE